jgi:hypothetical protein
MLKYAHAISEATSSSADAIHPTAGAHRHLGSRRVWGLVLLLAVTLSPLLVARAQDRVPEDEIVADLASGRVDIIVAKDAIVIGVVEKVVEPNSRPPVIVPLGSRRAAVLLGAVDWLDLVSGEPLARLSKEVANLHPRTKASNAPHLQHNGTEGVAEDIESVGLGVFERLRELVARLHAKIELPADEPLFEVLLADYLPDYGPEIWVLSYFAEQNEVRSGYLETRVSRPHYLQLWPPEKGAPKTVLETRYPPDKSPSLLDLLHTDDPRLQHVRTADPKIAAVANLLLQGATNKALAGDVIQFLRAALDAIATAGEKEGVAAIGEQTGFDWILQTPEPKAPGQKARPADAPTLQKPSF